ncbi:hypothetical protein ACSJMR_10385, partial [Acinetobacter pecorum]|uniref:hypothetical protein n=1 Tax=Acinetobacter pecorum TaxID=2762215 RepID=UPI003EE7F421
MLSNNAQKWLESFLQDYFGVPITLKKIGNSINLNVNDICFVKFDHFNSDFYRIGKTELNCGIWNPEEEGFHDILKSSIYSPGYEGQKIFELNKGIYYCHFDILGLIYWCLNRLEEIGAKNLDKHE